VCYQDLGRSGEIHGRVGDFKLWGEKTNIVEGRPETLRREPSTGLRHLGRSEQGERRGGGRCGVHCVTGPEKQEKTV